MYQQRIPSPSNNTIYIETRRFAVFWPDHELAATETDFPTLKLLHEQIIQNPLIATSEDFRSYRFRYFRLPINKAFKVFARQDSAGGKNLASIKQKARKLETWSNCNKRSKS